MVMVLAIVSAILSFGTAKATQVAMNCTNSNKITLQAQQYCLSKLDLIRNRGYNNLSPESKSTIADNYSIQVNVGNETEENNTKKRTVTVECFYKEELLPRSTLKSTLSTAEEAGGTGAWIDNFPTSGIAPCDGIIVATSNWNTYMSISTSGVERTHVNQRSKYGQGQTNATCPVAKGERYVVSGGTVKFYRLP